MLLVDNKTTFLIIYGKMVFKWNYNYSQLSNETGKGMVLLPPFISLSRSPQQKVTAIEFSLNTIYAFSHRSFGHLLDQV